MPEGVGPAGRGPVAPPESLYIKMANTVADGQTAASWGEEKKTANTHPESAFGWVLIGGPLGARLRWAKSPIANR